MTLPNKANFCGGNYQEWLDVMLTKKCNATCAWCVEREGFCPDFVASVGTMVDSILKSGKTKIALLGGEPLMYRDLALLVQPLHEAGKEVYITTNGSLLEDQPWMDFLSGINISIHSPTEYANRKITGLDIDYQQLGQTLRAISRRGVSIRLNCNIIRGYVDNREAILAYLSFAKAIGARKVRFAELKSDKGETVKLDDIFPNGEYGINSEPYSHGCSMDVSIDGMPVNFRQMCGLQTDARTPPDGTTTCTKPVLYPDGNIYDGWKQTAGEEDNMDAKTVKLILETLQRLEQRVAQLENKPKPAPEVRYINTSNCGY